MATAIDPRGGECYCIRAGVTLYALRRDISIDVQLIPIGGQGAVPLARMIVKEAWLTALNKVTDVEVNGGYVGYPETPPWWDKRCDKSSAAPNNGAKPEKSNNVIQL